MSIGIIVRVLLLLLLWIGIMFAVRKGDYHE
jgi:hypothetical protein